MTSWTQTVYLGKNSECKRHLSSGPRSCHLSGVLSSFLEPDDGEPARTKAPAPEAHCQLPLFMSVPVDLAPLLCEYLLSLSAQPRPHPPPTSCSHSEIFHLPPTHRAVWGLPTLPPWLLCVLPVCLLFTTILLLCNRVLCALQTSMCLWLAEELLQRKQMLTSSISLLLIFLSICKLRLS